MQQASAIAKVHLSASHATTAKPSNADAQPESSSRAKLAVLPDPVIRRLWERMAESYGFRWTSAYGEDAGKGAGQTWAYRLAGLTVEQIAAGLEAAIESFRWPPTLTEFRELCLGIPQLESIRFELMDRNADRSPFAMLAWSKLDGYRFARVDSDTADRMLREAYALARQHVLSGKPLPEKPVAVIEHTAEAPKSASHEVAMAHLEELKKRFRLSDDEAADMAAGE